jgi:hypothetical protein
VDLASPGGGVEQFGVDGQQAVEEVGVIRRNTDPLVRDVRTGSW